MISRFTRTTLLAPFAALGIAAAAPASAAELRVTIQGVEKAEGKMMIALHGSKADYDAEDEDASEAVAAQSVDAKAPATETVFAGLEPGTYALKIFHDVDADGELDTNFFGIPSEPYAFSNNASGSFGPPSWEDASFEVTEDGATQVIELN